jgi:SAM-dependent methyltransferase
MNSTNTSTDAQPFKAAMRAQWDACAAGWDAHTPDIHAWLRMPTDAMFAMAGVATGARVLDVAAGAGDQTLSLAQRVGPTGHVLATDLSPAILAFARARADEAGLRNIETRVTDGEALGVDSASFDAAICRLGLMFFAHPLAGLREIHRALRPGGGLCTMVFSRPEKNPCLAVLMSTALKHAGLPPRDPFVPGGLMSLGQPGRMNDLFGEAGFQDVATTAVDAAFCAASVDDYLSFVRSAGGPIVQMLAQLEAAAADAAWAEMRERLAVFNTPTGWEGPNELLLTAGRRSKEMQ